MNKIEEYKVVFEEEGVQYEGTIQHRNEHYGLFMIAYCVNDSRYITLKYAREFSLLNPTEEEQLKYLEWIIES